MRIFDEIVNQVKQSKIYHIVYYGASTTSCEHVFPNWGEITRYVLKQQLYKRLGLEDESVWGLHTMNLALDGATSSDLLNYLDSLVFSVKPSLVIINLGKNDVYLDVSIEETEKNSRKIIRNLLDKGIGVVLTTSIPSVDKKLRENIGLWGDLERKLAHEFSGDNFWFVDFLKLMPEDKLPEIYTHINIEGNEELGIKPGGLDTVHFNSYGNALVAGILLKEIFGISFDADKFMQDLDDPTKQYPEY